MERVRLMLQLGEEGRKGIEIIKAMEKIAGLQLVRYSTWDFKRKFCIGCRGKESQAGDARIFAGFGAWVDPDETYRFLEIVNHPWIEGMGDGDQFNTVYLKTPKLWQISRALEKLRKELEEELRV